MAKEKHPRLFLDEAPADLDQWDFNWVNMPEFIQEKKTTFSQVLVRFETQEDLDSFAKIIGQKLTAKTKSIWHPHKPHRIENKKVWKDA